MELGLDGSRHTVPIVRWFNPPVLQTPESTRQARSFWMVAWPFLGVVAVVLTIAVVLEPATLARRAVTIGAVAVLVTVLHEISRRGRPVLASWMLVIGLVLIVTQRAWNTGGIHAPVSVFYTLFVMLAGLLLGARASLVTAIVCFAGGAFLTSAELLGWLAPPMGARPPLPSLLFVVLTLGLALVLQNLLASSSAATRERAGDDLVPILVRRMQAPIMTLLGHLGKVRQDATGPMAKNIDEAISGARAVGHLATSLLDVSRLDATHLPLERKPTDVVEVARSVATAIVALQPGREVKVRADSPVICRYKPELLRRILEHLVSSALEYTAAGNVHIDVSSLPGRVRIAVRDEGSGIPHDLRRRLYEMPGASALQSSSVPHAVLGLALCKLAVESAGGSMRIEDAPPRGSVVIVELPD